MPFQHRLSDPRVLIRVGLTFLILASLSRWFLHASAAPAADLADGLTGLLYGVSIGCLLLGVYRNGRGRTPLNGGPSGGVRL